MSTIISVPPSAGNPRAVERLLAAAAQALTEAAVRGARPARVDAVGLLARCARRQHADDLATARRTLALALGRIGGAARPIPPAALSYRIRVALRAGGAA